MTAALNVDGGNCALRAQVHRGLRMATDMRSSLFYSYACESGQSMVCRWPFNWPHTIIEVYTYTGDGYAATVIQVYRYA